MSDTPLDVQIADVVKGLNDDEKRVLCWLAQRIAAGRREYGPLDLATDSRDWRSEQAFELADWVVYQGFREVAFSLRKVERGKEPLG